MKHILVQSKVPKPVYEEALKMSTAAGISLAAWIRQTLMEKTGVNGLGVKVRK